MEFVTGSLRFGAKSAAVAAVVIACAACGGHGDSSAVPPDAVAVVDGTPISRAEFDSMLASTLKARGADNRSVPVGTPGYATLRNQVLGYLVQRTEFEEKAENDLSIEISDAQIDKRLTEIKNQRFNGSEAQYRKAIAAQGLRDAQVRASVRSQLLSEAIFTSVTKDVKVGDDEIEASYTSHAGRYKHAAHREVAHILVPTRAKALQLERRLRNGADFAELARTYSRDTSSKALGGRLRGGITQGETVPPFDKMAFSLKTHAISPPVHSAYGWHIIRALAPVKPAYVSPLSQVRGTIRQTLLQEKRNRTMTVWAKDATKQFKSKVAYAAGYAPPAAESTGATTTN
jgi:foldase protein PrsA